MAILINIFMKIIIFEEYRIHLMNIKCLITVITRVKVIDKKYFSKVKLHFYLLIN